MSLFDLRANMDWWCWVWTSLLSVCHADWLIDWLIVCWCVLQALWWVQRAHTSITCRCATIATLHRHWLSWARRRIVRRLNSCWSQPPRNHSRHWQRWTQHQHPRWTAADSVSRTKEVLVTLNCNAPVTPGDWLLFCLMLKTCVPKEIGTDFWNVCCRKMTLGFRTCSVLSSTLDDDLVIEINAVFVVFHFLFWWCS